MPEPVPAEADRSAAFRLEVQAFLRHELPSGWRGVGHLPRGEQTGFLAAWRRSLYEHRMLAVAWPEEYGGRGLTATENVLVAEECARAGVPAGDLSDEFSIRLCGNTLLEWGTEEQRRHFLPRILSGEYRFCQGFSEPDAGSDLAGLRTRAERRDGSWVINGQKIWTTAAQYANWTFLLAHSGDGGVGGRPQYALLLCPMDQEGVEVRPIRTMAGHHEFNAMFFVDAVTAAEHVVGDPTEGWKIAGSLLRIERGEAAGVEPAPFQVELRRLFDLAAGNGRAGDPLVRQRLASSYSRVALLGMTGSRTTARLAAGQALGAETSLSKIHSSEHHQHVTETAIDVLGAAALAPGGDPTLHNIGPDVPGSSGSALAWTTTFLNARAETIYGGSGQIQRNIIGEAMLGLPREPRQPRDRAGR